VKNFLKIIFWICAGRCVNGMMAPYGLPVNAYKEVSFRTRPAIQEFKETNQLFDASDFRTPDTDKRATVETPQIDHDDPYSWYNNSIGFSGFLKDRESLHVNEDWYSNLIKAGYKEFAAFRKGAEDMGVLGAIMTAAGVEIGSSIVPYPDYLRNPARGAAKYILKPYVKKLPNIPWVSTEKKSSKKAELGSDDHSWISEYLGGLGTSMLASVAIARVNGLVKKGIQSAKDKVFRNTKRPENIKK
jgi:hypothetical protein